MLLKAGLILRDLMAFKREKAVQKICFPNLQLCQRNYNDNSGRSSSKTEPKSGKISALLISSVKQC